MKISDVVRSKGGGVVTATPETTVTDLLALLAEHGIGSAVVSRAGSDVAGIVSERDVVRHLHSSGPGVLDAPVSAIMAGTVLTCGPQEDLETVARTMTENRVRHIPVVDDDGALHAIVSIGDLVKSRIDQLEAERDQLMAYIHQ